MAKKKPPEGSVFVRFFGPLLDALRGLGGSGTPDEVVERIANDLKLPDEIQNELLPSGEPRFRNQVAWARFYLVREGLLDSSKRGVWSLTERGRSAILSLEQSREIFLKWVRIFQEQRRAKAESPEPAEEVVAEGTGASRMITAQQPWNCCFNFLPVALSDSLKGFCARPGSRRSLSLAARAMAELMAMAHCRSIRSFRSRYCFNANATQSRFHLRTYVIFAVLCQGALTKALLSRRAHLPPKHVAKLRAMGFLPSNLSTERSSLTCWRSSNLAFVQ